MSILSVLTPILIGVLPILALFQKNPGEVWVTDFFMLSALLSVLIVAIFCLFLSVRRNVIQASLATVLACLPLSIVNETYPYHLNVLVWVVGSVAALLFLFIPFKTNILEKIQRAICVPVALLVIFYGVSIGSAKYQIVKAEKALGSRLDLEVEALKKEQKGVVHANGDIYFIVLDEFVSPVAFRDYYRYDNESFFSFLETSGFRLVPHTYSNYPWTLPSVSSMVSLGYHKNWVSKQGFPQLAHFLLRYNMAAKLLESEGYRTYSIPSVYWFGNAPKGLWRDFLFRAKSYGLTMSILRSTPFAGKAREYQRREHRDHIREQLARLEEIAQKKGEKKFVFTHFLCPHRPIVFDKEGKDLVGEHIALAEKDHHHKYYLDQAYYISQAIQKMVETILASSQTPPTIVIVSDHGKFPIGVSGKGHRTLPLEKLSWRLSNLIALRFANASIEIPELLTPINILRMLLQGDYGYDLPLLEDMCHPDFFDLEKEEASTAFLPFQYERVL